METTTWTQSYHVKTQQLQYQERQKDYKSKASIMQYNTIQVLILVAS